MSDETGSYDRDGVRRAHCMGTVPHDEHSFNGGMWCPGLTEPDPEPGPYDRDKNFGFPEYVVVLGEKLPGIVAELLVGAMMESGEEDPRNAELYALRKTQITWGAGKVEPGEVERCIAAAAPWPAFVYSRSQATSDQED